MKHNEGEGGCPFVSGGGILGKNTSLGDKGLGIEMDDDIRHHHPNLFNTE